MNYKKISTGLLLILQFSLSCVINAQVMRTPGTSGASFLKMNLSARSEALGRGYCGLADDVSAAYYNPAGLIRLENSELQFSSLSWFEGVSANGIAFASRKENYSLGFDFRILQAEDQERALVEGIIIEGEKINLRDICLSIYYSAGSSSRSTDKTYGQYVLERQSGFGFAVKVINEQLYAKDNSAFAVDIGYISKKKNSRDCYGFALQNLGTNIGNDPLPLILRFGSSYEEDAQVITWELTQAADAATRISAGAEFKAGEVIFFRLGGFYQENFGYTAGLGIRANPVQIDYAYVPQGINGMDITHAVSLKLMF